MLDEAFSNIRGSVMIAYPMGLPDHDAVQQILSNEETIEGTQAALSYFDPDTCTLWWAGKQLARDKTLASFVGKNEKTKIVAKLQKKNAGPHAREAAVDPETQKDLMAYWYKKQEEAKVCFAVKEGRERGGRGKIGEERKGGCCFAFCNNPTNISFSLETRRGRRRFVCK